MVRAEARSQPLSPGSSTFRAGPGLEANDYHVALRAAAARLLAFEPPSGAARFRKPQTVSGEVLAVVTRKGAAVRALRRQRVHYRVRARPFPCSGVGDRHAAARPRRQRFVVIRRVSRKGTVASASRRFLSASGDCFAALEADSGY